MPFKILVVDDEPDLELLITQKFRKQIRMQEYQFFFAQTGEQALFKLQAQNDIDMVLSDINMPGMDGLTLLTKITQINPIIKTVIISAYGDTKRIRKAMNGGAFDFLTKPIDFQDLENTINKTLKQVQQLKETIRLRQEQEMLRQQARAFKNIYDGIIITDLQGQIVDWNPSAERMFGYSKEEVLGKNFAFLPISEQDGKLTSQIIEAIRRDDHWAGEINFISKNGTQGVCETIFVPLYNELGERIAAIGVNHDITKRKQAEIEIRKALEKEKELSELRYRFVTMASHEFRTPLTTILSSSDLIKSFGHRLSDEKKLHHLNKIQTAVKKITNLLDDILLIGKSESGHMEVNPVLLNLELFCRDLVEEMEMKDDKKHIFDLRCQGDCSSVAMDEKLLGRIINNLLDNAVKYSPGGGLVQINLVCDGNQSIFQIRDEGIGIPASEQSRLFQVFHRASNVGSISGSGLGMAIIKQAVELHGGTITLESEVGVGTTFTVCLPMLKMGSD